MDEGACRLRSPQLGQHVAGGDVRLGRQCDLVIGVEQVGRGHGAVESMGQDERQEDQLLHADRLLASFQLVDLLPRPRQTETSCHPGDVFLPAAGLLTQVLNAGSNDLP